MLILRDISYIHPNRDLLFSNINLTINKYQQVALIGPNGAGKSTLLKIVNGQLLPASGEVVSEAKPYFVPQHFGQYNHLTVAQAMGIDAKLEALNQILAGIVNETNLSVLNDDWAIEERSAEALSKWELNHINVNHKMNALSGGEKTKVFLAGMLIHDARLVLLDEPSNHLDANGRQLLYNFLQSTNSTVIVVSHDRKLLNLLNTVCELSSSGLKVYGGNYDFYGAQKSLEVEAAKQALQSKEKLLRKARETARETAERQQKLDSKGKRKQEKEGLPTIAMNTFRNNAEKSTARLKSVHADKMDATLLEVEELRSRVIDIDEMKFILSNTMMHKGKLLIDAKAISLNYGQRKLWGEPLRFEIRSGERIALSGSNGSGKTTLIKLMLGTFQPSSGELKRTECNIVYIDQDYSLISSPINIYEQALRFNVAGLEEHEIKIRLARFLFTKDDWKKSCNELSGGERMRLMLCCLTLNSQPPDMIILDEPTNNLDLDNLRILGSAISGYRGTLVVVSHDEHFLQEVGIQRTISV